MKETLIEQIDQVVFKQAGRIQSDVNSIEARMNALTFRLSRDYSEEEDLCRRIWQIQKDQQTLSRRIGEAAKKMNIVKTLLASRHS